VAAAENAAVSASSTWLVKALSRSGRFSVITRTAP
jgi:hypothetical protein